MHDTRCAVKVQAEIWYIVSSLHRQCKYSRSKIKGQSHSMKQCISRENANTKPCVVPTGTHGVHQGVTDDQWVCIGTREILQVIKVWWLWRQRQVWFIPLADKHGVCIGKIVRSFENACHI